MEESPSNINESNGNFILSHFVKSISESNQHLGTVIDTMPPEHNDHNLPSSPVSYFGATCTQVATVEESMQSMAVESTTQTKMESAESTVVIDLQGGDSQISKHITFLPGGGKVVVKGGTLRASETLPGDRHLVETNKLKSEDEAPPRHDELDGDDGNDSGSGSSLSSDDDDQLLDDCLQGINGDDDDNEEKASGLESGSELDYDSKELNSPLTIKCADLRANNALMYSYTFPQHEQHSERLALGLGFRHVSISSALSPMVRVVPRGLTASVDASQTPVIKDNRFRSVQNGAVVELDELEVSETSCVDSNAGVRERSRSLLSFLETSQEPLPEANDGINSAHYLSVEAAYMNNNFSQQVLIRDGNKVTFDVDRRYSLGYYGDIFQHDTGDVYDENYFHNHYDSEGNQVKNDETIAQTLQEEFSHLAVAERSSYSLADEEHFHDSKPAYDWHNYCSGGHNYVNEGCSLEPVDNYPFDDEISEVTCAENSNGVTVIVTRHRRSFSLDGSIGKGEFSSEEMKKIMENDKLDEIAVSSQNILIFPNIYDVSTIEEWRSVAEDIVQRKGSGNFRATIVDWPGLGFSDCPKIDYNGDVLAAFLVSFINSPDGHVKQSDNDLMIFGGGHASHKKVIDFVKEYNAQARLVSEFNAAQAFRGRDISAVECENDDEKFYRIILDESRRSGTTIFEIICAIVESLLDYHYVAVWDRVFDIVSAMFLKNLEDIQKLPDEYFSFKKHLHACLGSALVVMGPETLLSLVTLNLHVEVSNIWLLPILKQYIVGAIAIVSFAAIEKQIVHFKQWDPGVTCLQP